MGHCGDGCGLPWSWVWVIMVLGARCGSPWSRVWLMELGVGYRGPGCGSSWSWVWEVLKEVCRTQSTPTLPCPLETLLILLGRVAGNAIQLSAVVGRMCLSS